MRPAPAIIVVFVMQGCGACHSYQPKVQKIAKRYPTVPLYVLDAAAPRGSQAWQLAERYSVAATPTTLVLRYGPGSIKVVGDLEPGQIEYLFALAAR